MEYEDVNVPRRRFLLAATATLGAVGSAMAAVPFVVSMSPSARARAAGAPVEVDIGKLENGQLLRVAWRGKPVWVLRRPTSMLATLPENDPKLRDPESLHSVQPSYCRNESRAIKPEYFVVIGICTHLGCSPTYRPDRAPADLGPDWRGGWFCPCHGSRYDLAARVYKDVPAPLNMEVPPHHYVAETGIVIGVGPKEVI